MLHRINYRTQALLPALLLLTFISLACEGPVGPPGPAGPEGPAGPQGTAGEDGNANVIVREVSLTDEDFSDGQITLKIGEDVYQNRPAKVAEIEDADITAELIADGLVLVYMKHRAGEGAEEWRLLPERFLSFDEVYHIVYKAGYSEGKIRIYYYFERNRDGAMPDIRDAIVPGQTFKYAIIPGNAASKIMNPKIGLEELELL
jgi:hypothetical protein